MSNDMLGPLVRKIVDLPPEFLGTLRDLTEKLGGKDGNNWLGAQKRFLRKEDKSEFSFLKPVGRIAIPATEEFIARDNFVENISKEAGVRIGWLNSNFDLWFLNETILPAPKTELRCASLKKQMDEVQIITELGNCRKMETNLAQLFALLKMQSNGEDGWLLNNEDRNIFFVRDIGFILRVLWVWWKALDHYWCVGAEPIGYPSTSRKDSRVFFL